MFNFFEIIVLCVVVFICIYALVDRICTCVENQQIAESYQAEVRFGHDQTATQEDDHSQIGFKSRNDDKSI